MNYKFLGFAPLQTAGKDQTASRYLKQLVRTKVLVEAAMKKEKSSHPKLIQLLTRDTNDFTPYPSIGP